jgi:hypothetical protein
LAGILERLDRLFVTGSVRDASTEHECGDARRDQRLGDFHDANPYEFINERSFDAIASRRVEVIMVRLPALFVCRQTDVRRDGVHPTPLIRSAGHATTSTRVDAGKR